MAGQLIGVQVTTNAPALARALRGLALEQLPFATAVALTRVAQDSREEVVANMPQHFQIRSQRVIRGVVIERARKSDWPNPQAKVGTRDEFMALQVTGGVKKPISGRSVAVPTRLIRRTSSGAVPAALKPRPLRSRQNVFVPEDHGSIQMRFLRPDRTKGKLANLQGVGRFFTLVPEAKVPARWPMPQEVEGKARDTYGAHFTRELEAAIRSARAQAGRFTSDQGRTAYLVARTKGGRIGT